MKKTRANWIYSALAGAAGMAGACIFIWAYQNVTHAALTSEFETGVNRKTQELQGTINRYENTLRLTAKSLSTYTQGQVSQAQFRTYVESLDLKKEFPGTLGMAFIRKVPLKDEVAFLTNMHKHENRDFQIKFITPSQQDRFIVQYIEPFDENQEALGLDLGSESSRRENSLNAFTRMGLSASRPITMIQNTDMGRNGFTMMVPVFKNPIPPKDLGSRYENLIGWVAFPISIDGLIKPWLSQKPGLQAKISIVENTTEPTLFFDNVDPANPAISERPTIRRDVQLGNVHWSLEFWPEKPLENEMRQMIWLVWVVGTLLAGLFIGIWTKKQLDRRDAIAFQTRLVNHASDALIAEDTEGEILMWNRAAEEFFGHDQASALENYKQNSALPDKLQSTEKRLIERVKKGETLRNIETTRMNNHDQEVNLSMNLAPLYDKTNTLIGYARSFRDMTEIRQIWKTMNMLEELISYAPDGVVTIDSNRKIQFANPVAIQLLHQGAQDKQTLLGLCITDLLARDRRIDFEQRVLNPLFTHGRVHVEFDWSTTNHGAFERLSFRGIFLRRTEDSEPIWGIRFEKKNHSHTHNNSIFSSF